MTDALHILALSLVMALVSPFAAARSESKTLTSADGLFQIKYSALITCEHRDGENPDVWSPEAACVASIPVCDGSEHSGDVLACLAYPRAEFQGSELQAAAFAVSRLESFHTADQCMRFGHNTSGIHEERINGIKYQVGNSVETENSHVAEHTIYRTFHKVACYELDLNLSLALDTAFAVEDKPRKLTSLEREKIKSGLAEALAGFRFLK